MARTPPTTISLGVAATTGNRLLTGDGDALKAVAAGRVTRVQKCDGYGWNVIVNHGCPNHSCAPSLSM
jgi:septal ring factor EnvC (AmiA/AmiB activator)